MGMRRWLITLRCGHRTRTVVAIGAEPPHATRAAVAGLSERQRLHWLVAAFREV